MADQMCSILGSQRLEVGFLPTLSWWAKRSLPSHPDYTSGLPFFQFPFSKKLLRPHRLGTICVLLLSPSKPTIIPKPSKLHRVRWRIALAQRLQN
jgi:hypothetical protein